MDRLDAEGPVLHPVNVAFRWFQQKYGKELIETTLRRVWSEGSRWYLFARSRTGTNPRSSDNTDEVLVIDEATGSIIVENGCCTRDGNPAKLDTHSLLLVRHPTLLRRWCCKKDPKYVDLRRRSGEAAKFLRRNDRASRIQGAEKTLSLIQQGADLRTPDEADDPLPHPNEASIDPSGGGIFEWLFRSKPRGRRTTEYCRNDGTPLPWAPFPLLIFVSSILSCSRCGLDSPNYSTLKSGFNEIAKLLRDTDEPKRRLGAHMIAGLVEEGAGIRFPPTTEWQGKPHYNVEYPPDDLDS